MGELHAHSSSWLVGHGLYVWSEIGVFLLVRLLECEWVEKISSWLKLVGSD